MPLDLSAAGVRNPAPARRGLRWLHRLYRSDACLPHEAINATCRHNRVVGEHLHFARRIAEPATRLPINEQRAQRVGTGDRRQDARPPATARGGFLLSPPRRT
jgi:hypothetical protein